MTNVQGPLIGWPLLPKPDTQGEMHYPTLAESVRQTIEAILRTRPGEQLMRPTFGGGLANYLHEPNTLTTQRRIREAIMASLGDFENRIMIDRVEVSDVPDEPTHIRIELAYRLRRTGTTQQLGLTMMLEG
jgi:hypothetical protein